MKSLVFFLLTLSLWGTAGAQQQFTDIGALTDEEIALTKPDFDPEAAAILLRKDAIVFPDEDGRMIVRNRVRLKILRPSGVDQGNIKIRFQHLNEAEQCTDIRASVYNLDASGNRTTAFLNEKDIYTRKIDDYFSNITFSLPDVRTGSIIEYTNTGKGDFFHEPGSGASRGADPA